MGRKGRHASQSKGGAALPLDGTLYRRLQDILVRAFPRPADLAQVARFGLGENLSAITADGGLGEMVFRLIEWADARDRVGELVRGALMMNPENRDLHRFAAALGLLPAGLAPIADYSEIIQRDPRDAVAYNNRGYAYSTLERYPEALVDLSRAIALDPGFAMAHNNRGCVYDAQGRYAEALADFSRALEIDPGYVKAWYNRSLVYGRLGRPAEAAADLARAQALDPTIGA
jgi:tetratricopeptide (TPR) repeat protein